MREGEVSRTAIMVAALRAVHPRLDTPVIFNDPFALAVLPQRVAERVEREPFSFDRSFMSRYLRTFVVVRTLLAEDQLADAVRRGVRQYVVLGAGFDTFALRNPFVAEGLRVFELDHPSTQKVKRAILAARGITPPDCTIFAPVDLATTRVDVALRGAGFDATQPSVIAWLGVSMYLDLDAIRATLRAIAALPDTTLIFDFATRPRWYQLLPRLILAVRGRRVAKLGEPWKTLFRPEALLCELEEAGFRSRTIVDGVELTRIYLNGSQRRLTRFSNIAVASTR